MVFYHKSGNLSIVGVYAVLLAVWSSTWIAIKVGLHGAPPLVGAGLRFLSAGLLLAAFRLACRRPLAVPRPQRRFVAVIALTLFAIPYGLVYAGETQVTAGLAAVLWSTVALFAALYASRLLPDEPLTALKLAGIGAGVCGLVLVFHGGLGLRTGHLAVLAMLGLLAAPACGAYGRVIVRRDGPTLPQTVLLAWSMGLAGLALLAVALVTEPYHVTLDARTLGAIAYLSLIGSVLPFMLLYWLLGKVRAVSAALIDLSLPLVTLLAGWAFYGEALSVSVVAGAVVVVAGLALATADARRVHV